MTQIANVLKRAEALARECGANDLAEELLALWRMTTGDWPLSRTMNVREASALGTIIHMAEREDRVIRGGDRIGTVQAITNRGGGQAYDVDPAIALCLQVALDTGEIVWWPIRQLVSELQTDTFGYAAETP